MTLSRNPLRPLASGLGALFVRMHRPEVWGLFALLAASKAAVYFGVARVDLLPAWLLGPLLDAFPQLESVLHYPDLVLRLPRVAQLVDVALFVSIGALVQGSVIAWLARQWGAPVERRGFGRQLTGGLWLVLLAALLAIVPYVAARAAETLVGHEARARAGIAAGFVASMLLFVAPAFVVVHGMSLGRSIAASIRMLASLPVALPVAVALVAVLHVPGLVLQSPTIQAGAASDPDWILYALLGQLPAELLGAVLSAGLAAYFAARTGMRRSTTWRLPAAVVLVLLCTGVGGCGSERGQAVRLRYDAERAIARARLRALDLETRAAPADSLAWLAVERLYDSAVVSLGTARLATAPRDTLERDLARLACRALLGRAETRSRSGRAAAAQADYRFLLEAPIPFRGLRGDAALGLAECEDRDGRWNHAHAAYTSWMQGIHDGTWPLHRDGLSVGSYVERRLRNRGQQAARAAWVDLASAALEAAASRGEKAREARTARFTLLLSAERWQEAYAALRVLRLQHGTEDRSGALLVAEASLLAGGLGREQEALGILAGLDAENSPFDAQHQVAGWLLLGEIRFRAANWSAAERAYLRAAEASRSDAGRSEALLGLARVRDRQGNLDAARRLYAQLRESYPSTPAGLVAPLEEIRLLIDRDQAAELAALVPIAIHTYRAVLDRFGTERPALVAARSMSECMGLAGDWRRGVAFLDSIADTFGNDPRAGSLLVQAARLAASELEDRGHAGTLLAELYSRYPDSDVAVLARGLEDSLGLRVRTP